MRSRVDFFLSQPNYAEHLAPIWHALDPDERGGWHLPSPRLRAPSAAAGVAAENMRAGWPALSRGPCVVAGGSEVAPLGPRPVVLLEHGVGQVYEMAHPSYSGGPKREAVVLFLCPNDQVATRNRVAYPNAAAEVVGSPRLDELVSRFRYQETNNAIALSFHWDCRLTPESRWALPHYQKVMPAFVAAMCAAGHEVIGHGHPRMRTFFPRLWQRLGVEYVPEFGDVVDRAQLYLCDNSSTLYEWAALGRPVVVLNAPHYRRDVDLWPRFWACADVGVQVDRPEDLEVAAHLALLDPPAVADRRRAVVDEVTPLLDGKGAERAVAAIRSVLS